MSREPGSTDPSVTEGLRPAGSRGAGAESSTGVGSAGSDMAKGFSQASYGLSVACGFVGCVIGLWFVGRLVDGWLGIEPWAQVVGSVAGWVLGVVVVYYAAQKGES